MLDKFNLWFFPYDSKPEHFKALDGLRGLAVLLVLLSHSSYGEIFIHEYLDFRKIGKVGVYLFFVLSAYLLDRQIAQAFILKKTSKRYWANYAMRRFLRIYPLFFIALLSYGALHLLGFRSVINRLIDIPKHLLLLSGEGIFWSIPVEFKYYLISPFIIFFCHKYLKWDRTKLLFLFSILIICSISIELTYNLPSYSTLRYLPIFLIGTMISIYELTIKNKSVNLNQPLLGTIGIISLSLIILSTPYYAKSVFNLEFNLHASTLYLPYAILWGIILISTKYGKGLLNYLLEVKALRFIGTVSFSVYLSHMPIIAFVMEVNIPESFKFYLFFFLTILLSSLSFLLIERPLSKIRIHPDKTEK